MSKECYKKHTRKLLTKLSTQSIPVHKKDNLAYIKRSIELAEEGWKNTVVFDKSGDIVAAAAYETFGSGIRIETLGSIGSLEKGVTPGMTALYNVMKVAEKTKTGTISLYSTPNAVPFYTKFEFKPSADNGRLLYAQRDDYKAFIDYYESLPEMSK